MIRVGSDSLPSGLQSLARAAVDFSSPERRRMRSISMGIAACFDLEDVRSTLTCATLTGAGLWNAKFLDYERFLRINAARAISLGLDRGAPRRVLDLGCGPGYFLAIARAMGHETLGLDLADNPVFNALIEALRLRRVSQQISPLVPLPQLGRFDLITGFRVCFDRFPEAWATAEWKFFLRDVLGRLTPGGVVHLLLNEHSPLFNDGSLRADVLADFRAGTEVQVSESSQIVALRRLP